MSNAGLFPYYQRQQQATPFNLTLGLMGYSQSTNFSLAVRTEASRESLADSVLAFIAQYPNTFNGISVDYEFVSNNGQNFGQTQLENDANGNPYPDNIVDISDADNYLSFLQLLKTKAPNVHLAMCTTAAPEKALFDINAYSQTIDAMEIMTYDLAGAWSPIANHQANLLPNETSLYSAHEAVKYYMSKNCPANKIYIGVASYARSMANTDGLNKPCSGGATLKQWSPGIVDYTMCPPPGSYEVWDSKAMATYSYDSGNRWLWSYDSVDSVRCKCAYVHANGLAGLIHWEASSDVHISDTNRSLAYTMWRNLEQVARTSVTVGPTSYDMSIAACDSRIQVYRPDLYSS